jgi:hypothetical protein
VSRTKTTADKSDLLVHSADTDENTFRKLGWETSRWEKQIRPTGWEYPSYASADGVGNVFLIVRPIPRHVADDRTLLCCSEQSRMIRLSSQR